MLEDAIQVQLPSIRPAACQGCEQTESQHTESSAAKANVS